MATSPDGKWVIATSETDNKAHWIDIATGRMVAETEVDQRPRHAEFTADGRELWVTSEIGGTLQIIVTATRKVAHSIAFKPPGVTSDKVLPVGVHFTPDGR